MGTVGTSLIIASAFVAGTVAIQVLERNRNRARLKGLELKPNCLLTRYPIAFIGGRPSLFRLTDYWQCIPAYLREHGYDVLLIEPAPGDEAVRSVTSSLAGIKGKVHLIADSCHEKLLKEIAREKLVTVASLTVVRNEEAMAKALAENEKPELTPLPNAVEIFNVRRPTGSLALYDRLSLGLLFLHNLIFARKGKIDPVETATGSSGLSWRLESRFLDLAISLAERDARWSD